VPPRRATGILSSFLIFKLEHTRVDPQTRSHGPSRQGFVTSDREDSTTKVQEGIEKQRKYKKVQRGYRETN
jgi:hypothetical protein